MTQVVAKSWIMNKNIWLKTTVLLLAQRRLITFLKESQMAQNYCEIINTSFGGFFGDPGNISLTEMSYSKLHLTALGSPCMQLVAFEHKEKTSQLTLRLPFLLFISYGYVQSFLITLLSLSKFQAVSCVPVHKKIKNK